MEITVSAGRKIYKRGAGGYYDSTHDSFTSQKIELRDDATPDEVLEARFALYEELDLATDLHLYINGMISSEEMLTRKKDRREKYKTVIAMLTRKASDPVNDYSGETDEGFNANKHHGEADEWMSEGPDRNEEGDQ